MSAVLKTAHQLQSDQAVAFVWFRDGSTGVFILCTTSYHWLEPEDLKEVGYADRIQCADGVGRTVVRFKVYFSGNAEQIQKWIAQMNMGA